MKLSKDKIERIFYSVEISEWDKTEELCSYIQSVSPPSYMVKMALQCWLGKELYSCGDKSDWEVCIYYKNKKWIISDWKRYKWRLFGPDDSEKESKEIEKKLIAAAKILNKDIQKIAEDEFRNDNISIYNQFWRIKAFYSYFLDNSRKTLKAKGKSSGKKHKKPEKILSDILNQAVLKGKKIEYNLISAIIFFFSLTELIFDSCFSLNNRKNKNFNEFRKMEWSDRFKFFISPSEDKKIEALYKTLIDLRTYYRNIPVHASPTFFFQMDGFGLIPSNYETLEVPHISKILMYDEKEQLKLIEAIENGISLLKNHENTKFGFIYAESGLPIHIEKTAVDKLKLHMESMDSFKEEIERRNYLQDRIDNMDI